MKKILFVCTGNICRSPSAHAILRQEIIKRNLQSKIFVDSAATDNYHIGQMPDQRARNVAQDRNINFSNIKSRKVEYNDFFEFDIIFAMDLGHKIILERIKPQNSKAKIELFLQYLNIIPNEVKDPYYGTDNGFEDMFDILENAIGKLFTKLNI